MYRFYADRRSYPDWLVQSLVGDSESKVRLVADWLYLPMVVELVGVEMVQFLNYQGEGRKRRVVGVGVRMEVGAAMGWKGLG